MRGVRVGGLPLALGVRYLFRHHVLVPATLGHGKGGGVSSGGGSGSSSSSSSSGSGSGSSSSSGGCREVACEHFLFVTDVRLHSNTTATATATATTSASAVPTAGGAASASPSAAASASAAAPASLPGSIAVAAAAAASSATNPTKMHARSNIQSQSQPQPQPQPQPPAHLPQERDPTSRAAYPRRSFHARVVSKKCMACRLWGARYEVHGDRLTDRDPFLFCQHCYFALHYTPDGQLLYDDFAVVPYVPSL